MYFRFSDSFAERLCFSVKKRRARLLRRLRPTSPKRNVFYSTIMPFDTNAEPSNRKWFVLVAASLGTFLGTVMATSVNVALPSLVSTLETKFAVVQWVVLSFLLTNAVLLPIVGRLADMFGKKSLFIAGYVIFTLGSLFCGFSQSVFWLIGFRVVQGAGAALLTALSLAIVTDVFPDNERGKSAGDHGLGALEWHRRRSDLGRLSRGRALVALGLFHWRTSRHSRHALGAPFRARL